MKHHLKYARYLFLHKWYVLRAGLLFKAPLWRLLIHDWSKFLPGEWIPYARYFYKQGWGDSPAQKQAFDTAWLKHQHRSPHHWQHWVLKNDDGTLKALPIPDKFVKEMLADWMGAGKAITGSWYDVYTWYEREKDKMVMHPGSREYVEHLMHGLRGHKIFCKKDK